MIQRPVLLVLMLIPLLNACSNSSALANPPLPAANVPTNNTPTTTAATNKGTITSITAPQLKMLLKQGITLVDIRRPDEWSSTGVVAGSKLLTLFDEQDEVSPAFPKRIKTIAPPNKPVILICRTGNRSSVGAQILTQTGYSHVYNVSLGITDWIAGGNPVVKP